MICPDCNGSGRYDEDIPVTSDPEMQRCERCAGRGIVPDRVGESARLQAAVDYQAELIRLQSIIVGLDYYSAVLTDRLARGTQRNTACCYCNMQLVTLDVLKAHSNWCDAHPAVQRASRYREKLQHLAIYLQQVANDTTNAIELAAWPPTETREEPPR